MPATKGHSRAPCRRFVTAGGLRPGRGRAPPPARLTGVPTSRYQLIPLMIVTDPVDAACRWPMIAWYSSDS